MLQLAQRSIAIEPNEVSVCMQVSQPVQDTSKDVVSEANSVE